MSKKCDICMRSSDEGEELEYVSGTLLSTETLESATHIRVTSSYGDFQDHTFFVCDDCNTKGARNKVNFERAQIIMTIIIWLVSLIIVYYLLVGFSSFDFWWLILSVIVSFFIGLIPLELTNRILGKHILGDTIDDQLRAKAEVIHRQHDPSVKGASVKVFSFTEWKRERYGL